MTRRFSKLIPALIILSSVLLWPGDHSRRDDPQRPTRAPASVEKLYYDEIFHGAKIRLHYAGAYAIYDKLSAEQKEKFAQNSVKKFIGDQALDPLPRILTVSEMDELKRGVQQRGTALRMFLEDYYSGGTQYRSVIPGNELKVIIERSGETAYKGLINPKSIVFPYGPDIIRDRDGVWRVLEDNPGNIGGPGDIIKGREILFEEIPEYKKVLDVQDDPARFFKNLISRYKGSAIPSDGKIILYTLSLSEQSDKEDVRLRKIMKDNGVDYVTPSSKDKKLVVEKDGVYLEHKGRGSKLPRERVGFVIMNADHKDLDFSHPGTWERALLEEAESHLESYDFINGKRAPPAEFAKLDPSDRKLFLESQKISIQERRAARERIVRALEPTRTGKPEPTVIKAALAKSHFSNEFSADLRRRAPGLIQAILEGKVAANYTPGLDFIGDKEFNTYVDDLVRLYLEQEPILRNIPSRSFAKPDSKGRIAVDEEFFAHVFKNKDQFVIKMVDGRGGDGIWVGPKIPQAEFEKAKAVIMKDPSKFRAQEYKHLSVLDDRIVDLRLISYVDSEGVLMCDTPWGRAISMHGDGKVNISSKGFESPVIVVRDQCSVVKQLLAK